MNRILRKIFPIGIIAAAIAIPIGLTSGASAATGDFATCNNSIPADPSWHACYDHVNTGGPANLRGTHSWSNFHWYASFYNKSGGLISVSTIQGPYTGTSYHADVIAPATTYEIIYVVHNNCGCGMNDQFWVK